MPRDWLGVVEAAYRTELDEAGWLDGILEAARPILDHRAGIAGLLYDASAARLQPLRFATAGLAEDLAACAEESLRPIHTSADPMKTFGALSCGLISRSFAREFPRVLDRMRPFGVVDMLAVNGLDPSLRGVCLTGYLPVAAPGALASRTRAMWTRVSAHLAAGYRMRRRAAPIEAVLSTDGVVRHAEGGALEPLALEALREATQQRENARTRLRYNDPDTALGNWKGLVDARWSLVDRVESDGTRSVVARVNDVAPNPVDPLHPRERQVAAFVALGHPTKMIAYTLGLQTATVAALVGRACKRLGLDSRMALAREYSRRLDKTSALH